MARARRREANRESRERSYMATYLGQTRGQKKEKVWERELKGTVKLKRKWVADRFLIQGGSGRKPETERGGRQSGGTRRCKKIPGQLLRPTESSPFRGGGKSHEDDQVGIWNKPEARQVERFRSRDAHALFCKMEEETTTTRREEERNFSNSVAATGHLGEGRGDLNIKEKQVLILSREENWKISDDQRVGWMPKWCIYLYGECSTW